MNTSFTDANIKETPFFNYSTPTIQQFVEKAIEGKTTDVEKATHLYYLVRDKWVYNPYSLSFRSERWKASEIMQKSSGHCIDKAVLLITFARACGIPAKLHLAKVTNHIAVEKLTEKFGTNILTPHGYVELFLNEKWVKATPTFNKELCQILNVAPLDFDGIEDSYFQEYNKKGAKFMEYLEDYGTFSELPLEFMITNMKENYPDFENKYQGAVDFDFSK